MSPEQWQLLALIFGPSGILAVIFGFVGRYMLGKLSNEMALIKSNADDKADDNANLRAVIDIVAVQGEAITKQGEATIKLVDSIGTLDNNSRDNADKQMVAIKDNGKKLDKLDKTLGASSNNTIAHIDVLSSQLRSMQEDLESMSKSAIDNKSQYGKFEKLISELKEVVSNLNVITDAKERTQPLPDLSAIIVEKGTSNDKSTK